MTNPIRLAAKGTVQAIGPVTKAKKAGGTYTVYEAILDTGVTVDFGFSPPAGINVGDTIEREVLKEYGKLKDKGPLNGQSLPDAFPGRGAPAAKPAATGGTTTSAPAPSYSRNGVFPIVREDGQTAIIRQNALTNAVKTIIEGGFLDDKPATAVDEVIEEIIRVAYQFAAFSSGQSDATYLAKLGADPK